MDVSKNIAAIRKARRLTQAEVADKIGIERSNYPRLEKRGNKLTLEQIDQIAKVFDISVAELINYDNPASNKEESEKVKQLEKRVKELEEQLQDRKGLIDAIKVYFTAYFDRLFDIFREHYEVLIDTPEKAKKYAEKYNEPELLEHFMSGEVEKDGKKEYDTLGFVTPKAKDKILKFIFEEIGPSRIFLDLGLIDQELEEKYNLSYNWKLFHKKNQGSYNRALKEFKKRNIQ
ncbi:helix-turn-helix transcriptional regulator [Rhodocytophaga rosea]|uniref:Helix-turn-helix transcriptional regulator n=1 Tax=Rhodocytophaga rosea TaxID=2704465 RepID=A0A6C0GCQ4_9BACT|nr:helix-turn-helix domain-containing protein [Rhodocytophaga rosea]QHT65677.1 helix-turn-helix transcriptional regulator [Rhodocytophaga rosea]